MENNSIGFNRAHSNQQSALYDAYLESIKDDIEAHDALIASFTADYNDEIKHLQAEYNLAIKPEYDATAKIVNPKTAQLQKQLERLKETYTRRVNDKLAKFAKWQDEVLAKLEPLIADRKAAFEEKIKPFEQKHSARVAAAQADFEALTKPAYDKYIAAAKQLEDEFEQKLKDRATISGIELEALHAEYEA